MSLLNVYAFTYNYIVANKLYLFYEIIWVSCHYLVTKELNQWSLILNIGYFNE